MLYLISDICYLGVKGIPSVIKHTDKVTGEFFFLKHFVLQSCKTPNASSTCQVVKEEMLKEEMLEVTVPENRKAFSISVSAF